MSDDGHPVRSSSLVVVWPFLERLDQSWVCIWPKFLSSEACINIWCVSAAVFPSLKPNFIQTRCSLKGHRKTSKLNNGNTFTNNKPNHSTRHRLPQWFKKFVWRDTYRYLDILIIIRARNSISGTFGSHQTHTRSRARIYIHAYIHTYIDLI
jgi:hypothetical protein